MPNHYRGPDSKAMAGEVDRLLRQLDPAAIRAASPRPRPLPAGAVAPARSARTLVPSPVEVWVRVALGVVLLIALTQWPYRTCGLSLGGYLFAVGMVPVAGVWGDHGAWQLRMGVAHVAAILVILAGVALGAHEVLARVGYTAVGAEWSCPG